MNAQTSQQTLAVVAAGSSLAGAFLGATLQYLFTRRADRERHRREMVAAAYAAYLNCVGEMEGANQLGGQALAEAKGRAIAAKARLCVDGAGEVVAALAAFESRGTGEMRATMFRLVGAMRDDVRPKGDVSEDQISEILFGPRKQASS